MHVGESKLAPVLHVCVFVFTLSRDSSFCAWFLHIHDGSFYFGWNWTVKQLSDIRIPILCVIQALRKKNTHAKSNEKSVHFFFGREDFGLKANFLHFTQLNVTEYRIQPLQFSQCLCCFISYVRGKPSYLQHYLSIELVIGCQDSDFKRCLQWHILPLRLMAI